MTTRMDTGLLSLQLRERTLAALVRAFAPVVEMRERIHNGDTDLLAKASFALPELFEAEARALRTELSNSGPTAQDSTLENALLDSYYRNRIIQGVLEEIYSERVSPPPQIHIEPMSPPPKEACVHAVLFQHGACIGNELYPLMIDAYDHNCRMGRSRYVMGVHVDWLTSDGFAARAIVLDVDNDAFIEAPLAPSLAFDSVQLLAVSAKTRRAISRKIASRPVVQVNPYSLCDAMDDKFLCWKRWRKANVLSPPARILPRKSVIDWETMSRLLQELRYESDFPSEQVVIQPNRGTEGRDTNAFTLDDPAMVEHVHRIANRDDVLIRCAVASVEMHRPNAQDYAFFDLRINVCDGAAESGFFLVAQPGSVVASPARGGRIVEWRRGDPFRLRTIDNSAIHELDDSAWRVVRETAEKAASVFEDCRLAGVDVRLDRCKNVWRAWALDINPCPAGLMYACYLDGREQGVTRRLWRWLDDRNDAHRS